MPNPGQANNPTGINSFDGFGNEEPYGQATQDARLAAGAPVAGGPVTVGALGAPRKAQKAAGRTATSTPAPAQATPGVQQPQPQAPSVAGTWAAIAASPGADQYPILQQLAQQAASGG